MTVRVVTFVFFSLGSLVLAEDSIPRKMTGLQVVITMTGRLAVEYSNRAGIGRGDDRPAGYRISVLGTIVKELPNQQCHIECTTELTSDNKTQPRIMKLTGAVDSSHIKTSVTPKGTVVLKSPVPASSSSKETFRTVQLDPASLERSTTKTDHTTHRLELSELKGLKIQTWQLIDELAE